MIATPANSAVDVDTIVVGGGPVGLSVALGLRQRGARCLVVERDGGDGGGGNGEGAPLADWSKSFTYSIDGRGRSLMDALGVAPALERQSRNGGGPGGAGGKFHVIRPDGTRTTTGGRRAAGRGTVKLQRGQLVRVLRDRLRECDADPGRGGGTIVKGTVRDVAFPRPGSAAVHVARPDGTLQTLTCRAVVGCDGINSRVRRVLTEKVDGAFRTKSVRCPSAGLVFRSILARNPDGVSFGDLVSYRGRTGHSATMLSFHDTVGGGGGRHDDLRPLSMARRPDYFLYRCATVDELYGALEDEFPQLDARERIPEGAVRDFLDGEGVTFPRPTWARRAACVANGVPVVLVGDSLHHFPPDVGQGLNAGLLDAVHFLKLWDDCDGFRDLDDGELSDRLRSFGRERAREAECVCRLIPHANPWHQYNLHGTLDRIGRLVFTAKRTVGDGLFGASEKLSRALRVPNVVIRPSVTFLLTRSGPSLPYSDILRQHRQNEIVGSGVALAFCVLLSAFVRLFLRRLVLKH